MDSLYQGAQNLVPHTLFFIIFIYSSTGCAGSSLLHGLSLAAASGDYSLVTVHGLLITVASLAAEDGLQVLLKPGLENFEHYFTCV